MDKGGGLHQIVPVGRFSGLVIYEIMNDTTPNYSTLLLRSAVKCTTLVVWPWPHGVSNATQLQLHGRLIAVWQARRQSSFTLVLTLDRVSSFYSTRVAPALSMI